MEPCKYSKSQIERAGKKLVRFQEGTPEYQEALTITNNWRAAHAFPLNTFKILLAKKAKEVDSQVVVVQRLKRLASIKQKLNRAKNRGSGTNLSKMQDLGGCRVIFKSVDSVYQLKENLKRLSPTKFTHTLVQEKDYIQDPKLSGYRGIHLVYQFNSVRKREYNGLKIEIQIRTFWQHLWATTVESTEKLTKTSLKSSIGPAEWLRFFALMSSVFAVFERQPIVPDTPSNLVDLVLAIQKLDERFHLYDQLKSYQSFVSGVENNDVNQADYYLLIMDYQKKVLTIVLYEKKDFELATLRYNELEAAQEATGNNVVLVAASSLENIKKAYPNYFNDIGVFVEVLSIILEKNEDEALKPEYVRLFEQLKLDM